MDRPTPEAIGHKIHLEDIIEINKKHKGLTIGRRVSRIFYQLIEVTAVGGVAGYLSGKGSVHEAVEMAEYTAVFWTAAKIGLEAPFSGIRNLISGRNYVSDDDDDDEMDFSVDVFDDDKDEERKLTQEEIIEIETTKRYNRQQAYVSNPLGRTGENVISKGITYALGPYILALEAGFIELFSGWNPIQAGLHYIHEGTKFLANNYDIASEHIAQTVIPHTTMFPPEFWKVGVAVGIAESVRRLGAGFYHKMRARSKGEKYIAEGKDL